MVVCLRPPPSPNYSHTCVRYDLFREIKCKNYTFTKKSVRVIFSSMPIHYSSFHYAGMVYNNIQSLYYVVLIYWYTVHLSIAQRSSPISFYNHLVCCLASLWVSLSCHHRFSCLFFATPTVSNSVGMNNNPNIFLYADITFVSWQLRFHITCPTKTRSQWAK